MGLLTRLFGSSRAQAQPTPAAALPRTAANRAPVFSVLDVETTGLSPRAHRVIELAIVRLDAAGRVIDEWMTRFNPEGPVGATHIHGITDADVTDAPRFADLVPTITNGLAGTVLVAHNARFDIGFLAAEYARAGWALPDAPTLCTMQASHHYLPGIERRRLTDCCEAVGIALGHAHSALADARATAQVLAAWLPLRPELADLALQVERRASIPWPAGPTRAPMASPPARPAAPRRTPRPTPPPTSLGALLRKVRFATDVPDGTPGKVETEQYVEKLLEVMADGVLEPDELAALSDLAELYDLDPETVASAHRTMVEALVLLALLDGKVSRAERAEVAHLSSQLGISEADLKRIYEQQRERRLAAIEAGLSPLPAGWSGGDPLRVGDKVVFTGGGPVMRAELEEAATQKGLEVTSSVSRFTALLVSDGIESGKSREARQRGTRTVTYEEFAELLRYTQPRIDSDRAAAVHRS